MYDEKLAAVVRNGGIAVMRTDTLYGIVARADNEQAVERVFEVKHRDADKALIVLVARPEKRLCDVAGNPNIDGLRREQVFVRHSVTLD